MSFINRIIIVEYFVIRDVINILYSQHMLKSKAHQCLNAANNLLLIYIPRATMRCKLEVLWKCTLLLGEQKHLIKDQYAAAPMRLCDYRLPHFSFLTIFGTVVICSLIDNYLYLSPSLSFFFCSLLIFLSLIYEKEHCRKRGVDKHNLNTV